MRIVKLLLVALLLINTVACKQNEKEKTAAQAINPNAVLETATVGIEGMTCEIGCAKTIEAKISKIDGVTESKVNFNEKTGTFIYDSNKVSKEEIVNKINGLIDGKTYTANLKEGSSCKPGCEKKCCSTAKKECTTAHKEACCKTEQKQCAKECENTCEHGAKKECKPGCEKSCCNVTKKECKADCKKACCATKK